MSDAISKTMLGLIERAGLCPTAMPETDEACGEMLDVLSAESEQITLQIEAEKAGITSFSINDHRWFAKASHALRMKRLQFGAVSKWQRRLRHATEAERAETRKRNREMNESQQAEAEARRAERHRRHLARMETEATAALAAVRALLRTMPPDQRQPFYDAISAAEADCRARDAGTPEAQP